MVLSDTLSCHTKLIFIEASSLAVVNRFFPIVGSVLFTFATERSSIERVGYSRPMPTGERMSNTVMINRRTHRSLKPKLYRQSSDKRIEMGPTRVVQYC